ncbi:F-box/LRR-repeat protein [Raphanus sativus]|nr:F-box/LRR-repeat protein [Raphanus sativus]
MKKRCGQSMDRISQVPDAVLAKILSSLPTTKGVVATAVLSKQWRFLWKMVPKLTFRYNGGNDIHGFSDSVRRTMLSLEALYLQSLHLDVSLGEDDRMDGFGELVGIACGLHVRELVLELSRPGLNRYPIILDNCQSLETLKLRGSIALEVPSPVSLTSLRTLHLEDVFYDSESVVNLLSGCVRLENLFVTRNSDNGVETFTHLQSAGTFAAVDRVSTFLESTNGHA